MIMWRVISQVKIYGKMAMRHIRLRRYAAWAPLDTTHTANDRHYRAAEAANSIVPSTRSAGIEKEATVLIPAMLSIVSLPP